MIKKLLKILFLFLTISIFALGRNIMADEKKYVSRYNVRLVSVPLWEEFNTMKIFKFASEDIRF